MSNENKEVNDLAKFLDLVFSLEPIEFAGIIRIMNISPTDKDGHIRKFDELTSEIIDSYISLNRRQRRNLVKLIKEARVGKIQRK